MEGRAHAYAARKKPCGDIDLELVTFGSANDFPEMILSMLTFLAHVGAPRKWTVYGDGTF